MNPSTLASAQPDRELHESEIPRPDYPRPQFRRERWVNLNGPWRFIFDEGDVGRSWHWPRTSAAELESSGGPFVRTIVVPFCPESALSGVGDSTFHNVAWYGRTFATPPHSADERVLLHFGAVDYWADVWVNGELAICHEGGHAPFSVDVTRFLVVANNTLVIRAEDPGEDPTIPRGKQDWKELPSHIFYSRTTGVWQTVWLEVVDSLHVRDLRLTPNVDDSAIEVGALLQNWRPGTQVRLRAEIEGRLAGEGTFSTTGPDFKVSLQLGDAPLQLWSPEQPALYDLTVEVADTNGQATDLVASYFGMRKIQVVGDRLHLNDAPIFLRLVLDQGYWPDGLLTAPTDDALRRDIELAIEMGFNGARKHQKVEDPRWLYWADLLGFLVWEEMPNAHSFSPSSAMRTMREWGEIISRDYNHPSVIAWVPINESNGCRPLGEDQRTGIGPFDADFASAIYHITKALDPTRPALSNDGWEHAHSDICTIHDYSRAAALADRVSSLERLLTAPVAMPPMYVGGHRYDGEPILITEFGGISQGSEAAAFGYAVANDAHDFLSQFRALTTALLLSPFLSGFCYTQLADVEHEQNGLLTAERTPKIALATINAIVSAPSVREREQ